MAGPGIPGPVMPGQPDSVFFTANDGTRGVELWRSDGLQANTSLTSEVVPGANEQGPKQLTAVGDKIYFTLLEGANTELWWYRPADNTFFSIGVDFATDLESLTAVGNLLFFVTDDGQNGRELWVSDGTAQGTTFLQIAEGAISSNPRNLTARVVDGNADLFFTADDNVSGEEVWWSDGVTVQPMGNINPDRNGPGPTDLVVANGLVYFQADDGVHGRELWKSDGTPLQAQLVADINTHNGGAASSSPSRMAVVGQTLFFLANDGTHGAELWKYDLQPGGTAALVADINKPLNPGDPNPDSHPDFLTEANGQLFFTANDGTHGIELWVSDGT
ncbi:MAG: hypothetical protein L0Z62_09930, partial [Gemmataceae bacterium]|nr:hypothetical protein [Gemmataceae bacterium]